MTNDGLIVITWPLRCFAVSLTSSLSAAKNADSCRCATPCRWSGYEIHGNQSSACWRICCNRFPVLAWKENGRQEVDKCPRLLARSGNVIFNVATDTIFENNCVKTESLIFSLSFRLDTKASNFHASLGGKSMLKCSVKVKKQKLMVQVEQKWTKSIILSLTLKLAGI